MPQGRGSLRSFLGAWLSRLKYESREGGYERRPPRKPVCPTLTVDHLLDLWHIQEGKCDLSGQQMTHIVGEGSVPTNVSPDRIENDDIYRPGNLRLVCVQVNKMRGEMTLEEFYEMCRLVLEHKVACIKVQDHSRQ